VTEPLRMLPLRVPPVEGESMDSWLEALARRSQITVRQLTTALGWRAPNTTAGLAVGVPAGVLRSIEHQADLRAGRLDDAVLDRYLLLAPAHRGSRYCPSCLAVSGGRWPLAWRLAWIFACPVHSVLLNDTCPGCGQVPRTRPGQAGLNPAGTCSAFSADGTRCVADLRGAAQRRLTPGGPELTAQHWASALLGLSGPAPRSAPAGSADALRDLRIVAGWALRTAPAGEFAASGPDTSAAWRAWHQQRPRIRHQARRLPPASAALTAAIAVTAMTVLNGEDTLAIGRVRALAPPGRNSRQTRPGEMASQPWKQLSGPARSVFLRALDPGLAPAERIRYRTGTPMASIPDDPPALLAARARTIPQALWPDWAIRLTPARGVLPAPFRSTIAACLLLPGQPAIATSKAITALHAYRGGSSVSAVLRTLTDGGNDTVITAISCLAGYLDTNGSPIDYQRRRDVIAAETITEEQWQELCGDAAAHPGRARRHRDAKRHLYQLLTGADLGDPRHDLAFSSAADRSGYHAFAATLTTGQRSALHDHAAALLSSRGISEPLAWAPPPGCCAHLDLPGPDPDDIDLDAVRELIIDGGLPVADAALKLGTSTDHVRLALERVPRPPRQWGKTAAPVAWQWQQRARAILTREFFEREYTGAAKTLRQLEDETGFPRKFLADAAREHGIPLTSAWDPAPIDPSWLREQYLHRKRSYTDIAAELGVLDVTVIAAARRHDIPSRPPGVHSQPVMIAALSSDIPPSIRRAVEGSLHGWLRLQRFSEAMAFPTLSAAAVHLNASPAALISQFQRLGHDTGGPLYHPSTPRQPMRPTRRGHALLKALQQPGISELMQRGAKVPARSRRPRPPRIRTRPPTPQELSLAFYATIAAREIRITPSVRTTLAAFLADPAKELYGLQLTDLTGLQAGTIYPLLTRLASAGWLTSRPEDDKSWQDRNPPGQKNRPRRRYHQLTPDGRKAADRELPAQQPR
jgi:hypothetical protein